MNFNHGNRMPVWKSQDKIRTQWLHGLCGLDGLFALFTFFGKSDSPAQVLLRQTLPDWLWPVMLMATAVLIELGFSVPGGMAGAAVWGILTAAILVTIFDQSSPSDGAWILPSGMAMWHALIIYEIGSGLDADRERRQRRG